MDWAFYGWSALLILIAAICGGLLYLIEDWRERRHERKQSDRLTVRRISQ